MQATIPVTIDAEAREYIDELGMQGPFQQMLHHALESIAGLRKLHVRLQPAYDMVYPSVLFWATKEEPAAIDDPTEADYGWWRLNTFPPDVAQHFVLLVAYESPDAR